MSRIRAAGRSVALVAGLAVGGGVLLAVGRRREDRRTDRLVGRLRATGGDRGASTAVDDHPAPVRRYFERVLGADADPGPPGAVRIDQRGELRVGGHDSAWKRFTAVHHATVTRPGFVWDATVEFLPGVSVRVRDAFVEGSASSRVSLFGAFPLATASSSPELDEAALQRYLAEAVWVPRALLSRNGVRWEGIDDRRARATLAVGDVTASLVVHFSETDEIERVHANRRYRQVGGGFEPTPWTGLWRDYEERDGVRVPTTGEVVWHLSDGDLHAWRGRVEHVSRRG